MRKTRKQYGGNMAEAQRIIDEWIAEGDVNKELDLSHLELTTLPRLPDTLEVLRCESNKLTSIPRLPSNLKNMYCSDNNLTSFTRFPKSLRILYCLHNQLTELPTLPDGLERLYCTGNELTSLPTLPNSLKVLHCNRNKLTSLPALPNSLKMFQCNNNDLPEVYYRRSNEPRDDFINRIRKLQKSRTNVTNSFKPHITEKKRNVFANTTFKNMPKNVVKQIANYMDEKNLENININSLKPRNVKRGETRKLKTWH